MASEGESSSGDILVVTGHRRCIQDGIVGEADVARSWLPNLTAGVGLGSSTLGTWGGFSVTHSLDWTPGLGSCHQDNSVTGDLSDQPL